MVRISGLTGFFYERIISLLVVGSTNAPGGYPPMKRVVNLVAVADKSVSGYRSTGKEYSSATESVKANDAQDDR